MNRLYLSILRGFRTIKSRLSSKQFLFISSFLIIDDNESETEFSAIQKKVEKMVFYGFMNGLKQ